MEANQNIYEEKIKIYSFLIDNQLKLAPDSMFSIMQEIAGDHAHSLGIGSRHLRTQNLFWALIKMHVIIDRMPLWDEIITLKTWAKPHDLMIQPRDFVFIDSNGNSILRATSCWVILDRLSSKPQRIGNFDAFLKEENIDAIERRAPKIAKQELNQQLEFLPVLHSDIDLNEHVNNAKYLRWFIDSMGHEFNRTHQLKELYINYISQTKIGERYGISTNEIQPNNFISSIVSDSELREICRIQTIWE